MKKLSLLLVVMTTTFFISNAQINFALKLGANLTNVTGDDIDGTDSKIGITGGAAVNIPVGSTFSVQPEVLFSSQGWKEDGDKVEMGYINVPVLLQYNNPSGFFAETGPQVGFLLSAKAEDEDVKDYFETTDFAWAIGAGFKMQNGFGIGARYNLGISNILKDAGDSKVKNSVASICVTYSFGASGNAKK